MIPGSHKFGRLDHHRVPDNGQLEASPDKVEQSLKSMDKIYLEMEAGRLRSHVQALQLPTVKINVKVLKCVLVNAMSYLVMIFILSECTTAKMRFETDI